MVVNLPRIAAYDQVEALMTYLYDALKEQEVLYESKRLRAKPAYNLLFSVTDNT